MTAAYMTRCIYLTFFGEYRGHGHPHESGPRITVPLLILAGARRRRRLRQPPGRPRRPTPSSCASSTSSSPRAPYFPIENFSPPRVRARHRPRRHGHRPARHRRRLPLVLAGPRPARASPSATGSPAPATRCSRTSTTSTTSTPTSSSAAIKGPIARAAYWFNQNVIDGVVNGAGRRSHRRAAASSTTRIDQGVVDGAVNGSGAARRRAAARSSASIQTGKVQQYGALLFGGRRASPAPSSSSSDGDRQGTTHGQRPFLTDWGLTLAVFLPLAGALVMMLIPKTEEALHKVRAPSSRRWPRSASASALLADFDYDQTGDAAVRRSTSRGSTSSTAATSSASTASRCRCSLLTMLDRAAVHHLLVEPLPRAAQPQGVPHPDPHPRDRHDRHVRRPGPDPVLRLLRGRAAADVLHDRRVGRRAAPVRVDQVLPVHAVRLGADDRQLPGAVLPDRRRDVRHPRPGRAAWPTATSSHSDPAADLRRHVHGLRHQGADVPVPHLAARRPHRRRRPSAR